MDRVVDVCRHADFRTSYFYRCCLSCGEVFTEETSPGSSKAIQSNTSFYAYEPLEYNTRQGIRLVHVLPGQKQDDVVCELFHADLASAPVYEAVSYTWATGCGDASRSQSIICCGKNLAVTKNCEAAIRCLRRERGQRILWIDAICINQSSIKEKSHQVRLMADIYSQASQVLVYLNYPDHGVISKLVEHLIKMSRGTKTEDRAIGRPLLESFLENPWFDRVWVLQEISLAKLVALHVDEQIIHWDRHTVDELICLCEDLDYDPPGVLRWLPATQREGNDSLDLLHRARHCMATDARDKVFALYSFFPAYLQEALPVDYALNTEEVYSDFATYLISSTKRLDVLKHVSPYQILDLNVRPSWVPHWGTRQALYTELPSFTAAQMRKFTIPDSTSISMETSSETGIHLVVPHRTINSRFPFYRHHKIDHVGFPIFPYLRVRGYLLDKVVALALEYDGHPVGDVRNPRLPRPDSDSTPLPNSTNYRFCSEHMEYTNCDEATSDKHRDYQSREQSSVRKVSMSLHGQKEAFITEQSGGFFLFPFSHKTHQQQWPMGIMRIVESGDTIWALEGLDVPVVLRPQTRYGKEHYVLVGQCYLHRAGLDHECPTCGSDSQPWSMEYATIDIW